MLLYEERMRRTHLVFVSEKSPQSRQMAAQYV